MSLGLRLFLVILLAALPVLFVQFAYDYQFRENQIEQVLRRAEVRAELVTARLDRVVEGARLLMTATSHLQSIQDQKPTECHERLRAIASYVPELTAIAVLDRDGERWCVSLEGTGAINLRDRLYFQETLRSGTMQTSNFIIGRQTGEGSLVFTYPVKSANGEIASILFVAYRTSVLSRLLNEVPLARESMAMILDQQGVVAARWPDPNQWSGRNLSPSDVVRRAVSERRGVARGRLDWAGDGEYAIAFAPMQAPTALTVVVALPLAEVVREADRAFYRSIILTLLIFAGAAALAFVVSHYSIVRPIRDLAQWSDGLAQGDFSRIFVGGGSKELRQLGAHFASMARSLEERQRQLQDLVQQKEILLKEVNHRIKNNLQLVASLISLQRMAIRDPQTGNLFEEASRRINIIAQIHQRLYQHENIDSVALHQFLADMCADIESALAPGGAQTIRCDATPCHLPTEQIIPLALIVNELITNAFKYGYGADRRGVIRVGCEQNEAGLIVTVSDNGGPLPDGFDPATSSGLGMRVILALVRQLRAKFDVVRRPDGKDFVVRVPTGKSQNAS